MDVVPLVDILDKGSAWRRGAYGPVKITDGLIRGPGVRCTIDAPTVTGIRMTLNGSGHVLQEDAEGGLEYFRGKRHNWVTTYGGVRLEGPLDSPTIPPQVVRLEDDRVQIKHLVQGPVRHPMFVSDTAKMSFDGTVLVAPHVLPSVIAWPPVSVRVQAMFSGPVSRTEARFKQVSVETLPPWNVHCDDVGTGVRRWSAVVSGPVTNPKIHHVCDKDGVDSTVRSLEYGEAHAVCAQLQFLLIPVTHGWAATVPRPLPRGATPCPFVARFPLAHVPMDFIARLGECPGMCNGGTLYIQALPLWNIRREPTPGSNMELWLLHRDHDAETSGDGQVEGADAIALPHPELVGAVALTSRNVPPFPSIHIEYLCRAGTSPSAPAFVLFETIVAEADKEGARFVSLIPANSALQGVYTTKDSYDLEICEDFAEAMTQEEVTCKRGLLIRDIRQAPANASAIEDIVACTNFGIPQPRRNLRPQPHKRRVSFGGSKRPRATRRRPTVRPRRTRKGMHG